MNDLIAAIRAAIEETERMARDADVKQGDPEWWVSEVMLSGGRHYTVRSRQDVRPIARVERLDGDEDEPGAILDGAAVAAHIARHDPTAVLRRCAADRKILDQVVDEANGLDMSVDLDRRVGSRDTATEPYLGNVLVRLLAEGYGIEVS